MSVSSAPVGLLLLPSRSSLSSPPQLLSLYFSIGALQNPSFLKFSIGSRWAIHKRPMWRGGSRRRGRENYKWRSQSMDEAIMFGSDEEFGTKVPTQAQSLVEGSSTVPVSEYKPIPDLYYVQELLAIQQQGPRAIGFFGTRNVGFMHQQLIEILSYAMVITKNHIFTSGASGTNAAVIRGALRAEKPELLV